MSRCWGGLGVRRRFSCPATASTPLVSVPFASARLSVFDDLMSVPFAPARPLIFGDLGGLDRRDRGVGVMGGEFLLETCLMPLLSVKDEAYWCSGMKRGTTRLY